MSSSSICIFAISLFLLDYTRSEISLGSKLKASESDTWVSQYKTFAFGFTKTGTGDLFLLAIWYYNLPSSLTIVWSPNRDSPVTRTAIVTLERSGNIALTDQNKLIWSSNTTDLDIDSAVMSDTGSFILYNNTGTARRIAWQSFDLPGDTLLPGQNLSASLELTSNRSQNGYYVLKMLQQHTSLSLALTFITFDARTNFSYWSSPQISNATGNVVVVLDDSGSFSITYGESSSGTVYIHKNESVSNQDSILRRIRVETDGNLRLYEWNTSTAKWDIAWSAVSNPCEVAGICGNGICKLDSIGVSYNCSNLPDLNTEHCDKNMNMDTWAQTNYYFLGSSTIANYSNVTSALDCPKYCQMDCDCVASLYGVNEDAIMYCWTLREMVFGGLQDPSSTFFVKNSNDGKNSDSRGKHEGRDRDVLLPLLLCVSALLGLLGMLVCFGIRRRRIKDAQRIGRAMSLPGAPLNFSYLELQNATDNFSELLGTGGFGSVYKGTLRDGSEIAVKQLERFLPHGEKEFVTEVTTIGSMHHMNLVTLRGFCSERKHRLLVYEYMSNGSLDKWIFPPLSVREEEERNLDWSTRFQIAISIAQGIAYFHEQCKNRIIHCDIKPENILLDEDFYPKVSDFGLAKLMSREHSHVVTMVRGTRGYLAPEWVSNRPITVKADVYSYGMLLLEIVGGRRNLDISLDSDEFFYPGWAYKEMKNGTPMNALDRRMKGKVDEDEVGRCLSTAFWCIQEESWVRPSMGEVVRMLEGSVEINEPPMPQSIVELVEEGLQSVYFAMKRDYTLFPMNYSSMLHSQRSSLATCSYSTMSPR